MPWTKAEHSAWIRAGTWWKAGGQGKIRRLLWDGIVCTIGQDGGWFGSRDSCSRA